MPIQILIPPIPDHHPLDCHLPRIDDRFVFEKLIQVLALGASYEKISDSGCSATSIQRRREARINTGIFTTLEQLCLDAYERVVCLELKNLTVDGCIVISSCGEELSGKSPADRGKQGTKRSVVTDGKDTPVVFVAAPANRHDSSLLRRDMEKLACFGFHLPEQITVHVDAGDDSRKTRDLLSELGCG